MRFFVWVREFVVNAWRNPKTTTAAIAASFGIYKTYQNDHSVTGEAWFWVLVFNTLSGMSAKDATTVGTAKTAKEEEKPVDDHSATLP